MGKSRLEEVNFFPQFYTDEKGGARFKATCVGHQPPLPPLSLTTCPICQAPFHHNPMTKTLEASGIRQETEMHKLRRPGQW